MVVLYTLRGKGSNRWSMKVLTYVRRREGIPQGFQNQCSGKELSTLVNGFAERIAMLENDMVRP